ncbi:MAG: methylated-DNA--[protein]-cysteine S-methyltransferase [bacterium]
MKKLFVHSFKTSAGTVRTAATDKGLAVIALPCESRRAYEDRIKKLFPDHEVTSGGTINKQAERQISAFLNGRLKKFTVKLDPNGTVFQKKVWRRVAKIDYGRTMTYGEIARAIDNAGASRAVGAANGANPLPLIVPCHRVVASTGLGGYGGGLKLKKRLLRMEGSL